MGWPVKELEARAGEFTADHVCPTCGHALVNGQRYELAPYLKQGELVEVSSPTTPLIVGTRVGHFVGYLADGRCEVKLGGEKVVVAADVVRAMPAPLTAREGL